MITYYENRADVAEYVYGLLASSKSGSPWTMTITPENSGGFYVHIVTDTSSDASEEMRAKFFSETQVNI